MNPLDQRDAVHAYLQKDPGCDPAAFGAFIKALKGGLEDGEVDTVRTLVGRAVSPELDYTTLQRLSRLAKRLSAPAHADPLRLAVLGGPTTVQLVEVITTFLLDIDRPVAVYECEYGQFRQEILTSGSGLDRFRPHIVFLATGTRDLARFPVLIDSPDTVRGFLEAEVGDWLTLWDRARSRWNASIIQNLFEIPPWSALGHFTTRRAAAPANFLQHLNLEFGASAPGHVTLHDVPSLVVQAGSRQWFDPRYYHEAKMPCGPECLVTYGHSVASLVKAILGKSRKVLVLDLDNTLWGGVIGDAGVEGIRVGQGSGEGEAFLTFQRYAKDLKERGVLLAVCSKNDEATARQPFERHDDMVLRLDDFACFVANWQNKADNLRTIARRLELGTDSFVFVDDNSAERAIVRRLAPEVAVPALPEDPSGYIDAVARHRYFETVSWTVEDASRAAYYADNARRNELRSAVGDVDSFLASLGMKATIRPVSETNIQRVTQLVNKSNQFNLTTSRRTHAEIQALADDPAWRTLTIGLADTLGDNGLISVIFLRRRGAVMDIDTWLMSCRVLQRGVEQAALNEIVRLAREAGCDTVDGTYIPTPRNMLVQHHYRDLGFTEVDNDGVASRWRIAVAGYLDRATHIEVHIEAPAIHV